jgi:hypothetical protein
VTAGRRVPASAFRWRGVAGTLAALAKNDDPGSESLRRALQEALASVRTDPARPEVRSPLPAGDRKEGRGGGSAGQALRPGADETVIRHVTFLGSFVTRRLDEVDKRLGDLADSLSLLQTSLSRLPDPRGPGAPPAGSGPEAPSWSSSPEPVAPPVSPSRNGARGPVGWRPSWRSRGRARS